MIKKILNTSLLLGIVGILAGCTGPAKKYAVPNPDRSRSYGEWMQEARRAHTAGNVEEAHSAASHAVALRPGNAAPYTLIGDLYAGSGFPDKAIRAYRDALSVDPGFRPARIALGWTLLKQGRIQEALDTVPTGSRRFDVLHLRGAVLLASGQDQAGSAVLREAKATADRLRGSVSNLAVSDNDCRLANADDEDAECPFGRVMP